MGNMQHCIAGSLVSPSGDASNASPLAPLWYRGYEAHAHTQLSMQVQGAQVLILVQSSSSHALALRCIVTRDLVPAPCCVLTCSSIDMSLSSEICESEHRISPMQSQVWMNERPNMQHVSVMHQHEAHRC